MASQDEVDFQEQMIIERESEIRNIEQSVGELNELFRDVAHMVHEQGAQLDIIEENVEVTHDASRGAHVNLKQASNYQKSARSKACILLLILAIVLVIIVLAVVNGLPRIVPFVVKELTSTACIEATSSTDVAFHFLRWPWGQLVPLNTCQCRELG